MERMSRTATKMESQELVKAATSRLMAFASRLAADIWSAICSNSELAPGGSVRQGGIRTVVG
jgi:hypothetical protein